MIGLRKGSDGLHPIADDEAFDATGRRLVLRKGLGARTSDLRLCQAANRILQGLEHPNIAAATKVTRDELGRLELCYDADDIAPLSARLGTSSGIVVHVLSEVCAALDAAHGLGVIHGALTLGAVRVGVGSEHPTVRVADFGLGDLFGSKSLLEDRALWLPYSPEKQLGLEPTPAEDVYLLGTIGYAMIAGHPLFEAPTRRQILRQHAIESPVDVINGDLDCAPWLAEILARCLRKEPDDRYPSPADVRAALRAGTTETVARPRVPAPPKVGPAPSLRVVPVPAPAAPSTLSLPRPKSATATDPLDPPPAGLCEDDIHSVEPTPAVPPPLPPRLGSKSGPKSAPGGALDDGDAPIEVDGPPSPLKETAGSKETCPDADPNLERELDATKQALSGETDPPSSADDAAAAPNEPTAAPEVTSATSTVQPEPVPARSKGIILAAAAVAAALVAWTAWPESSAADEPTAVSDPGAAPTPQTAPRTARLAQPKPTELPRAPPTPAAVAEAPVNPSVIPDQPAGEEPAAEEPAAEEPAAEEPAAEEPAAEEPAAEEPASDGALAEPDVVAVTNADVLPLSPKQRKAEAARLTREARTAARSGNDTKAVRLYQGALAARPGHAVAAHELGVIYFNRGSYRSAIRYARRATGSAPRNGAYRLALGDYHYKSGNESAARTHWRRASKLGNKTAKSRVSGG